MVEHVSSIKIRAPGKVILFGEHAVVHGKRGIAASVDLPTTLCLTSGGDEIRLVLPDVGIFYSWNIDTFNKFLGTSHEPSIESVNMEIKNSITKSFCTEFSEESQISAIQAFCYLFIYLSKLNGLKKVHKGLELQVDSELPIGSGLGSSASYSACLSAALLIHFGNIPCENGSVNNLDQFRNEINDLAFLSEKIIHGNPSGIDNTVCTFGGAVRFRKGHPAVTFTKLPVMRFILVNTRVPRQTSAQVKKVSDFLEKYKNVGKRIMEAIDEISIEFEEAVNAGNDIETERLIDSLVSVNHKLITSFGISHPKLDSIVSIANSNGFSAKLTGGGGGGCALIYIPNKHDISDRIENLKNCLIKDGFEFWEVTVGVPGVELI